VPVDLLGGSWSLGARYLHSHFTGHACVHAARSWFSYGVELRVADGEAIVGQGIVRAGVSGTGGIGLEGGLGAGSDFAETRVPASLGVLWSMDYFEVGALFHFVLGANRLPWLPLAQLAFRIQVPVAEHGRWERPDEDTGG